MDAVTRFREMLTAKIRSWPENKRQNILNERKTKDPKNQWAALRRVALIEALGGKCARTGSTERLEFDHKCPESRTWDAEKVNQATRMRLYDIDAAQGLIQLLTKRENAVKGDRPEPGANPF